VVQHLLSKHAPLSSHPSITKKTNAIISVDAEKNWVKAFNVRSEIMQLVGEKQSKTLQDIGIGNEKGICTSL
jgi:hypothetical protein